MKSFFGRMGQSFAVPLASPVTDPSPGPWPHLITVPLQIAITLSLLYWTQGPAPGRRHPSRWGSWGSPTSCCFFPSPIAGIFFLKVEENLTGWEAFACWARTADCFPGPSTPSPPFPTPSTSTAMSYDGQMRGYHPQPPSLTKFPTTPTLTVGRRRGVNPPSFYRPPPPPTARCFLFFRRVDRPPPRRSSSPPLPATLGGRGPPAWWSS